MFANFDKLPARHRDIDVLSIRVMAATGMRLGEVYQIKEERIEEGVRYVIIGTKTGTSKASRAAARVFTGTPKLSREDHRLSDCARQAQPREREQSGFVAARRLARQARHH
jgi:hypothetical protein